eukprot:CAMPEP_0197606438 /NCGR_PEP_ID=MMETSP1326-20131121/45046_1 /TAXON_ID=1155430 /ORGANISM="Genus nov. species nov., Strain RCC2288" /LENGTH=154 /DNA_ID=CAMNT_0043174349 /DNA_START=172 /DNA_END=633 /DNA_ORIENTATION=-
MVPGGFAEVLLAEEERGAARTLLKIVTLQREVEGLNLALSRADKSSVNPSGGGGRAPPLSGAEQEEVWRLTAKVIRLRSNFDDMQDQSLVRERELTEEVNTLVAIERDAAWGTPVHSNAAGNVGAMANPKYDEAAKGATNALLDRVNGGTPGGV